MVGFAPIPRWRVSLYLPVKFLIVFPSYFSYSFSRLYIDLSLLFSFLLDVLCVGCRHDKGIGGEVDQSQRFNKREN